nr:MAG TPA: hypothetical protein [Caudoviricetes sp.]
MSVEYSATAGLIPHRVYQEPNGLLNARLKKKGGRYAERQEKSPQLATAGRGCELACRDNFRSA